MVDDLLRQESFGRVAIDPSGRWLAFEQRDPYETAASFDYDQQNTAVLSRLRVVDLRKPGAARPLGGAAVGPGLLLGAFSPDGARLAVYRLRDHRWTLGVATLASGELIWLDVTPEQSRSQTLQWISPTALVVIARPDNDPPRALRLGSQTAATLPARWSASASGRGAQTAVGSGRYRQARPHAPPNVVLWIDVRNGARRALAVGPFETLEAAPGGRRLALIDAGDDLQPAARQSLGEDWGTATQRHGVSVLDLETGAMTPACPGCDVLPSLLSWSGTGRELLVYARAAGAPWTAGALRRIDAASGAARAVGQGGLRPVLNFRPEGVRAGWMGSSPVVFAKPTAPGAGDRADWYRLEDGRTVNLTARLATAPPALSGLDAAGLTLIAAQAVWRIDPQGRLKRLSGLSAEAVRPLTDARAAVAAGGTGAAIWALATRGGTSSLARLTPDGAARTLTLPPGPAEVRGYADNGRALVAVVSTRTDQGVQTLDVVVAGSRPVTAARINGGLAETDAPRIRRIDHTGPDGQPLRSWLYLPAQRSARPPPLIVAPYSGAVYGTPPIDPGPVIGLALNVRTLVGHGYAVLAPSLPLPRGKTDPVAGLADRIQRIVDTAAARSDLAGAFDPARTALWGHSYGGYTVMAVISQTSRYKAAIESGGPSDLFGMWGAFQQSWRVNPEDGVWVTWPAGWVETEQGGMGAPPWDNPARYARNSPWLAANRITTPLMLLHGDQDPIPLPQAEMMFSALYRQNKDAVLVTYWGEGHFVCSPGNVRDLYARAFAWLDDHLGDGP